MRYATLAVGIFVLTQCTWLYASTDATSYDTFTLDIGTEYGVTHHSYLMESLDCVYQWMELDDYLAGLYQQGIIEWYYITCIPLREE